LIGVYALLTVEEKALLRRFGLFLKLDVRWTQPKTFCSAQDIAAQDIWI